MKKDNQKNIVCYSIYISFSFATQYSIFQQSLYTCSPPWSTCACFSALLPFPAFQLFLLFSSTIGPYLMCYEVVFTSVHIFAAFHEVAALLAVSTWSVICKLVQIHRVWCIHVANCRWQVSLHVDLPKVNESSLQSVRSSDSRNKWWKKSSCEAVFESHSLFIQQPLWNKIFPCAVQPFL